VFLLDAADMLEEPMSDDDDDTLGSEVPKQKKKGKKRGRN